MNRKTVLVLLTIAGVAVLLRLGFWQKARLEWKRAYLTEIDAAVEAPPVTSVAELQRLLADDAPLNYRRIALDVEPVPGAPTYRVFAGDGLTWRLYAPVRASGERIFAALNTIPDGQPPVAEVPDQLLGHVRVYQPEDILGGRYSVDGNRYYRFNQDYAWVRSSDLFARIFIDHDANATSAKDIPVRRPDIPNNHFQYMLTWWSFAVILIIFAAILYRREA